MEPFNHVVDKSPLITTAVIFGFVDFHVHGYLLWLTLPLIIMSSKLS
jgi:hypothetical protein